MTYRPRPVARRVHFHGRGSGGREVDMEIARRYVAMHTSPFGAYLALQRALMVRYVARGGTQEDFCQRLAPVFRRRYAHLLGLDG